MTNLPENYFEKTKQVLIQKLNNCTQETITQEIQTLKLLLTTLEGIAFVEQQTNKSETLIEPILETTEVNKPTIQPDTQRLHRDLRNGHLEPSNIFIPEKIIRENNWQNGDYIEAKAIPNTKFYEYTLIKKDFQKNDRMEATMLVVHKSNLTDSPFEIHIRDEKLDIDLPIPLSKGDIERFSIQEGDVIDFAYWSNHMSKGLVVWKHSIPTQSLSEQLAEKAEKQKTANKIIEKTPKTQKYYKQSFLDKTIVMVGGLDTMAKANKEAIENRGGTFIHIQGKTENKEKIGNIIKKADLVIVYTNFVGHFPMWHAKEAAKAYQKPISFTKANGVNSFLVRCKSDLGIYN